MSHNNLSSYPYFNKQFGIYTDARNFQLGAFIIQDGKVITFYSRKLILKKKYTVMEKRTTKNHRNSERVWIILVGQKLIIYI